VRSSTSPTAALDRTDRLGGILLSTTRGLCNLCGALGEAFTVAEEGRVLLVKWCPEHGATRTLISSDLEWYLASLRYVKPATPPLKLAVEAWEGCPQSCGLCPQHQQHTCVPILEITDRCNLDCPVCLVHGAVRPELSVADVRHIVDRLLEAEGLVNLLTLSGGEPTLHPDFLAVVDEVRRPQIGVVSVSTNGVALAADPDLALALRDRGVVISLQLDGGGADVASALRGRPGLAATQRELIERLLAIRAPLSLTVTVARGVNEHALAEILDLFLAEDILSVMIQPLAHLGRASAEIGREVLDVVMIPEVIGRLAAASRGRLATSDFTPLPCSHPSCFALTYLLRTADGGIVPLPRLLDASAYLDVIKNQALLATDRETLTVARDALYSLWSASGAIPHRDSVLRSVRQLLLELDRLGPGAAHRDVLEVGLRSVKSIFIHHFMDRASFDLARAVKCCNHYPQVDGRLIPVCIRNNLSQWRH